jgi:hypothetical protein
MLGVQIGNHLSHLKLNQWMSRITVCMVLNENSFGLRVAVLSDQPVESSKTLAKPMESKRGSNATRGEDSLPSRRLREKLDEYTDNGWANQLKPQRNSPVQIIMMG